MKTRDKFDITNKVALVVGGAGLLGREFTETLLEFGGKVVVADLARDAESRIVEELQGKYEGFVHYECVDITAKTSVQGMVLNTIKIFGTIDIMVNCAALDPKFDAQSERKHGEAFEDYPLSMWQRALDVNLTGAFLCCQEVGKVMVRNGRGVIVNVASELGLIAPDHRIYLKKEEKEVSRFKPIDYPVTKAALIHLTRYLAAYWGGKNIRVNALSPAAVYTSQDDELVKNIEYRTILGRMSQKDEFNGALIFLVSDASSYMTGANLIVDGGRTAW